MLPDADTAAECTKEQGTACRKSGAQCNSCTSRSAIRAKVYCIKASFLRHLRRIETGGACSASGEQGKMDDFSIS
jgi:hypothetical protein